MKKRMSTVFFSVCFLAAILLEIVCAYRFDGDLFSVAGIGIVVLITGYLMLESIHGDLKNTKDALRKIYQEESERQTNRFNEVVTLQKATYTATKKNTSMLQEQLADISLKLETLTKNNEKTLHKMMELQKKSLEGQKNALNLEINYNKENTKQLIKAIQEESNNINQSELLNSIISLLDSNNIILQESLSKLTQGYFGINSDISRTENDIPSVKNAEEDTMSETDLIEDSMDYISETEEELETPVPELDGSQSQELNTGNIEQAELNSETSEIEDIDTGELEQPVTVTPIYDDPNKQLSADEIAALFASFGK